MMVLIDKRWFRPVDTAYLIYKQYINTKMITSFLILSLITWYRSQNKKLVPVPVTHRKQRANQQ